MIHEKILNAGGTEPFVPTAGTIVSSSVVIPEGVRSIRFAIIDKGTTGGSDWRSNANGGAGGNLRYMNDVPVKPGDTFSVSIGTRGASIVRINGVQILSTSQPVDGVTIFGGNGGNGGYDTYPGASATGGSAGTYFGKGANGNSSSSSNGSGSSLFGPSGGGTSYGYGSGALGSGSNSGRSGGPGGCRVIWGTDASYPYNAV